MEKPRKGTAESLRRYLLDGGFGRAARVRYAYAFVMSWERLQELYHDDEGDIGNLVRYFQAVGRVREVCAGEGC